MDTFVDPFEAFCLQAVGALVTLDSVNDEVEPLGRTPSQVMSMYKPIGFLQNSGMQTTF